MGFAARTTTNPSAPADVPAPESYLALIRAFPLARIRDDAHLAEAQAVIDTLSARGLDRGSQAYLDALVDLCDLYEDRNIEFRKVPPKDLLRELIEERGLTQQEFASAVEVAQSTISAILSGSREMNVDHITRFAKFFDVPPGILLPD